MEYFAYLSERVPQMKMERDFSFSRHTTIGCGGAAAAAVYPRSNEETAELLSLLRRERIPYCFLGAGANVLPPDGSYEGVVVRVSATRLQSDGERIKAGAGVTGGSLCRFARRLNLSGFEPFTGIPMTLGGGVTMNAGVAEGHFSDVVERVVGIEDGKIRIFSREDCRFSEKRSVFQEGIAVTELFLKGTFLAREEIEKKTEYFRKKRDHLPRGRSMGCTFVNPQGLSAGKLIDECGLKGLRVGGAHVSEIHANFIINEGGTSDDVAALIDIVKEKVAEQTGILLKEEIRRLGQGIQHGT